MEEKLGQLSFTNALLFGFLIGAAYYFLFYHLANPQSIIAELDRELVTIKGEIAKLDRGIKEGQQLEKNIAEMEKAAENVYSRLSENTSVQQASAILSQEARTIGLSIETIAPGSVWTKKRTLAFVDVNVAVNGKFSQIMVFLSELTRDNKVYSISEFRIGAPQGSALGQKDLRFSARIKAYRKLSSAEIEMDKKSAQGVGT